MKLRIISAIVAIVFVLSLVLAPVAFGRVTRVVLLVTVTTGSSTAFTADTTITSRKISFQADSTNAATSYAGDSTLDATSATTLRNTAMASLSAGSAWTPVMSDYANERGEQFRLSDFRASGTTGDKVRLVYETEVFP